MRINKTVIGVITFIILLIAAGYSAHANADNNGARISVGKTLINSHLKVGELGYEINNWEVSGTLLEAGDTKNGYQDQVEVFSLSYLTKPGWGYKGIEPYLRMGASYNSGSELVGNTNYRLGLGLNLHEVWRIEFNHYSSAGIHQTNTGIDAVTLTYLIPGL